MSRYQCIVSAGGFARRFRWDRGLSDRPKCLYEVDSQPLIVKTIENIQSAGVRNILVLNNRKQWTADIKSNLSLFKSVSIVEDSGFDNTFLLVKSFSKFAADRFLFLYGHAPRPESYIRNMIANECQGIFTTVGFSTKRKILKIGGRYIEPPYILNKFMIQQSNSSDWASFFEANMGYFYNQHCSGPGEANTLIQMKSYIEYYRTSLF